MLTEEFESAMRENNTYPMMIHTIGRVRKDTGKKAAAEMRKLANNMEEKIGLPIAEQFCFRNMIVTTTKSLIAHDGIFAENKLALSSLSDLKDLFEKMYAELPEPKKRKK